ncbi:MAG: O-antigen ligase family protein, partial [Cyanobacteria bacterium J06636_27]
MTKINFLWKPHSNPKLQFSWYLTQLGLLIFPLIPSLGALNLIIALVVTYRTEYRKIINRPLNWGFTLIGLLLIGTTLLADNKIAALLGLFNFVPFFLVFAGFSALIQTKTQLRQLSWILVIGSVLVDIIGIGHMYLGWGTSLFWEIILGWKLEQGINPVTRMGSVMMNSNLLAAYLIIVFTLGLGLWIENWQKIHKIKLETSKITSNIPSLPTPFILLTLILIGDFTVLILTHSRNGWGNAIFVCVAYAIYQGWYKIIAGLTVVATSIMIAARAPLAIAQWFRSVIPEFFWIRLRNEVYSGVPEVTHRKSQWELAWSLTLQRPWTGWGLRNFSFIFEAKTNYWMGHPHNLFLMLSAETGLPTTILFFGFLGWLFVAGVRLMQNSKFVHSKEDRLLLLSYLLVFAAWLVFNTVDVTIY